MNDDSLYAPLTPQECEAFAYRPRRVLGRRVSLSFEGTVSRTRQEFLRDSDMNVIVNKFLRTGELPLANLNRPTVDGLESPADFSQACEEHFDQRNVELQKNYEQETLAIQNGESQVPSSAGVQSVSEVGKGQDSQVEQSDKVV